MGFLDLFKRKSKDEELQPLPDFEEIESVDKDDDWGMSHMMKDHSSEIDDFFNNLEDKEKTVLDAEDLNPPSFLEVEEDLNPPSFIEPEEDLKPPSFLEPEEDLNPPSFLEVEEDLKPPSFLEPEEDLNPPSFEEYKESVRAKETRKALGGRDDGEVSPPPLLSKKKDDLFKALGDLEEDLNPPSFEKYKESVRAKETRKALGGRDDGEVSPPPLLSKKKEIDEKKKDDLFKPLGDLEEDFEDR